MTIPTAEMGAAFHEAGHAVALIYYLRGGLWEVNLPSQRMGEPYKAWSEFDSRFWSVPLRGRALEHRMLVLLAGAASERRFALEHLVEPLGGDRDDREMINRLLAAPPSSPRKRLHRSIAADTRGVAPEITGRTSTEL